MAATLAFITLLIVLVPCMALAATTIVGTRGDMGELAFLSGMFALATSIVWLPALVYAVVVMWRQRQFRMASRGLAAATLTVLLAGVPITMTLGLAAGAASPGT